MFGAGQCACSPVRSTSTAYKWCCANGISEHSLSSGGALLGLVNSPEGPARPPFQAADLRTLSPKMALLLALATVKRVGDLQVLVSQHFMS